MTTNNGISINLISIIFGMLISSTISVGLGGASHGSMYLLGAAAQPSIPDFNFAAAGDWGCNSNTVATVNSIVNQESDFTLGLGDYSYQSSANCFISRVNPIDENMAIAIGNHENSGDEDLNTYLSHFGGLTNQYYSFKFQNVHFLVMATEISYSSGSAQHIFVTNDLADASSDPDIDWIVVFFHKPMYSSSNSCSSSGCSGLSSLRDTYHALFDDKGVDLVLEGHVHDYQRSFPIKFNPNSKSNPIVTNNNPNTYTDPPGEIHVIVGTGGINFHELSSPKSFIKSQQDDKFGHLNVAITNNGKTLTGKFIANDNSVMDQFTITKTAVPTTEICNNGVDDDGDGKIDAEDVNSCPAVPEICNNRLDDDRDGFKDAEDVNSCPAVPEICNNVLDDDRDGFKDAEDVNSCPAVPEICNNGLDDDRDGFKDAEDVNSCPAVPEICNNGLDDDRDGFKDAEDVNSCPAVPEICNNGLDDDRDGFKDAEDVNSCPAVPEICNNGLDDDRDGFKDAEDVNSCPAVPEICNNGLDDDRDGFKDAADPNCQVIGYHYQPFFTATGSNFIDEPSSTALKLTKFSVAAWFKTSSTFGDDGFIVNKGGSGSDSSGQNQNYGLWFNSRENATGGYETTSGSNKFVTSPTTFNDNQWHHGVVTFDGSVLKLYIDGVQVSSLASTSTPDNTGNQPLRIGANSRSSSDFFVGQIDEVGVWGRALLKEEIDNLRNFGVFPSDWKYKNTFGISPTSIEPPSQEIQDKLPLHPNETAKGIGMEEKLQENSEAEILSLRDLLLPPIQSFIPRDLLLPPIQSFIPDDEN